VRRRGTLPSHICEVLLEPVLLGDTELFSYIHLSPTRTQQRSGHQTAPLLMFGSQLVRSCQCAAGIIPEKEDACEVTHEVGW
jgi:hypothetical protein